MQVMLILYIPLYIHTCLYIYRLLLFSLYKAALYTILYCLVLYVVCTIYSIIIKGIANTTKLCLTPFCHNFPCYRRSGAEMETSDGQSESELPRPLINRNELKFMPYEFPDECARKTRKQAGHLHLFTTERLGHARGFSTYSYFSKSRIILQKSFLKIVYAKRIVKE